MQKKTVFSLLEIFNKNLISFIKILIKKWGQMVTGERFPTHDFLKKYEKQKNLESAYFTDNFKVFYEWS